MKKLLMALAILALASATAWAVEDNQANREKEADRYLKAMPVQETIADMAEQVSKRLPADKQQAFKDLFIKYVDAAKIEKATKASLVKNLTVEELKALADFYGLPVGKSAMKKMTSAYLVDMMPTIQAEGMKAQAKAGSKLQSEEEPAE
jgi:hypothetical protein